MESRPERKDGLAFHILADARLEGVDIDPTIQHSCSSAASRERPPPTPPAPVAGAMDLAAGGTLVDAVAREPGDEVVIPCTAILRLPRAICPEE